MQSGMNPNGIQSFSLWLRGTHYPRLSAAKIINPEGVEWRRNNCERGCFNSSANQSIRRQGETALLLLAASLEYPRLDSPDDRTKTKRVQSLSPLPAGEG